MSQNRKNQIKESLINSFNMSYKQSMHKLIGKEKSIELVEEVFEILWNHKFTEDRKSVQKELEETIERYIKSKWDTKN